MSIGASLVYIKHTNIFHQISFNREKALLSLVHSMSSYRERGQQCNSISFVDGLHCGQTISYLSNHQNKPSVIHTQDVQRFTLSGGDIAL